MGIIPATGSQVSMGRISRSLGISPSYPPSAGANIRLNGTLGANRSLAVTSISNIPSNTQTKESEDFGGLTTPQDYPS